jgi:hypothetical protein
MFYWVFPDNFTFRPKTGSIMDAALHDDLLINCILSAAASRIQYASGFSPPRIKTKELRSTQQSLRLLKLQLEEPVDFPLDWTERMVTDHSAVPSNGMAPH